MIMINNNNNNNNNKIEAQGLEMSRLASGGV